MRAPSAEISAATPPVSTVSLPGSLTRWMSARACHGAADPHLDFGGFVAGALGAQRVLSREHEHARGRLPGEAADGADLGVAGPEVERDGLEQREHAQHRGKHDAHGPCQVVQRVARDARGARRGGALDARHLAELDGQFFDRHHERAHAVADGRQRVGALEIEAPQGERARLRLFNQELRARDRDDVAGDDDARARHRYAIDADAAFGRGIEQPAPGHRPQRGERRRVGRCRGIVVIRAHGTRARIDDHPRAVMRLALRGAQHDRRVE